ncbi:MAG TPA: alpha/beta hydrolase [Chitinophagaceae bacterium]
MLQAILNNYKFNYVESGNGDTLILVHGSASDYRTWEKQVAAFGNHYHTIAYSRRFHTPNQPINDTEEYSIFQHVSDLEALINSFCKGPVHLLGHSYGGVACLLLVISKPHLVKSLILAEPPVFTLYVSSNPKPSELFKLLLKKPSLAMAIIKFGATGIGPTKNAVLQNKMNKALDIFGKATLGASTYRNLSESRRQQAFDNLIKAEITGNLFPRLDVSVIKRIKMPVLLLSAQNSPKLMHYLIDELHHYIPGSEKYIIPGASHIMHEDNADDFNSVVLTFLKKHEMN